MLFKFITFLKQSYLPKHNDSIKFEDFKITHLATIQDDDTKKHVLSISNSKVILKISKNS